MNTKNAYEIRLDLLNIAHGDCMDIFHQKLESERHTFDNEGDCHPKSVSHERIDELFPKTRDILARAEELYKFVSEGK